jgi:hypothetical protein
MFGAECGKCCAEQGNCVLEFATRIGALYCAIEKVDFDETVWGNGCFGID